MSKGLDDFDYDTVAEMLNNLSAIKENTDQFRRDLTTIVFVLAVQAIILFWIVLLLGLA